jgi:lipoprotein-releasing system ATP-binding protein
MTQEIILRAKGITKTFQHPVNVSILNGVDFALARGETAAIMGRSGEGKSTLLHILGTLEDSTSGNLEIAGQQVSHHNKSQLRNKHIGFVFQSFHLLEDYTALDNVLMPARIARQNVAKGSVAYDRAYYLLEAVGMADRAHFNTKLLSGGEKQRISIARALCNDPDILLADEPSGNLDKQNALIVHEILLSFAQKEKKSLLVVTHDESLAGLCHTNYRLQDGRLQS